MTDITQTPAWQALAAHRDALRGTQISRLFAEDPDRFNRFSIPLPGILVDYAKNGVTDDTLRLLEDLARAAGVEQQRDAMFAGKAINTTEDRAVLHTALRGGADAGDAIARDVRDTLQRMKRFAEDLHSGAWKGYTGRDITDIVNIGIGGSSLGPELAVRALAHCHHPRLRAHFVANVEASALASALAGLDPETTLFIVVSKTFTTSETMRNARVAREWLLAHFKNDDAVRRHIVAATANNAAAEMFGIGAENIFPFRDWVGGRYSLWSAAGLSVISMTGAAHFDALLAGAAEMDAHFKTAPLARNLPVVLGMIGIWHRNFCGYGAKAVIPYHAALARLPAYLQQLDMESNGKTVTRDGAPVAAATGPLVFGEAGTDAQHSFFQWLHQSPDVVPVDFIAAVKTPYGSKEQQAALLSNCLAQSAALMSGRDNAAEPHRHFAGNRPSTTILLDELSPRTLGLLLALYEHIVFVQGAVWQINSFDQWGVELGKALAQRLESDFARPAAASSHDSSTGGLMAFIRKKL